MAPFDKTPRDLPYMAGWFEPGLLIKLLWRVIVSDVFGQYADRRLVLAALDPVDPKELVRRAQQFMPGNDNEEVWAFTPDEEGAVWIDYVADLGDGFDATYAMASLLARETLRFEGKDLASETDAGEICCSFRSEAIPARGTSWASPKPN
ncbi:hypothetical protein [Bradyrhizobium sp. 17]|uniref:hypothetical protein n=1 Tax=Bradyrhizobium sp. 17 TaxID=2782649 RepID=UPI001FFC0F00|nr:hypothetical protein [Bradyrhizobium sp. 17]MCK1522812.1 hypothetical protein [Bradyrhizobium sp. 17]